MSFLILPVISLVMPDWPQWLATTIFWLYHLGSVILSQCSGGSSRHALERKDPLPIQRLFERSLPSGLSPSARLDLVLTLTPHSPLRSA
ncbi:hypothetical protein BDV26DRAFT_256308 [Aspergillus bertholletiae]|uniref:Uncharacterized protein n=1 Tax=Aspergillus bertholletiae TaxID=1226010 RepID=A0A5N7BGW6_9EURO|nr:hypothetical protein BDV26DRAFT_256308 [Aspergillus bertholletiae]